MEAFNYDTIINELVESLKERVDEYGDEVYEAAHEIVDGSTHVIYTRYHYKVLDASTVDPAEVVAEFGIDYGNDFHAAIAQTVYGCLYRDMLDAYYGSID